MSVNLMYEKPESNLMTKMPRNAKKDRLTNAPFFLHIYLFYGVMIWVSCCGLFFDYMYQVAGLRVGDILLAFDKWGKL